MQMSLVIMEIKIKICQKNRFRNDHLDYFPRENFHLYIIKVLIVDQREPMTQTDKTHLALLY